MTWKTEERWKLFFFVPLLYICMEDSYRNLSVLHKSIYFSMKIIGVALFWSQWIYKEEMKQSEMCGVTEIVILPFRSYFSFFWLIF